MIFKNFEEADTYLRNNYANLWGIIDPITKKKNWALFVGINDHTLSSNIYQGIRGNFPTHHFNQFDLNNIEFWVGYFDETILPLNNLLEDPYLKSLCEGDALHHHIQISGEWSDPIRIPLGLSFKIKFTDDTEMLYEMFDAKDKNMIYGNKMSYHDGFQRLFRYNNEIELQKMSEPFIKFKASNPDKNSEIYLRFVNE